MIVVICLKLFVILGVVFICKLGSSEFLHSKNDADTNVSPTRSYQPPFSTTTTINTKPKLNLFTADVRRADNTSISSGTTDSSFYLPPPRPSEQSKLYAKVLNLDK